MQNCPAKLNQSGVRLVVSFNSVVGFRLSACAIFYELRSPHSTLHTSATTTHSSRICNLFVFVSMLSFLVFTLCSALTLYSK